MGRKAVLEADELSNLEGTLDDVRHVCIRIVDNTLSDSISVETLENLQREATLAARDLLNVSARLYSQIRMAKDAVELAKLKGK